MKRWKSKFLLGAVLFATAVSVNAKAINLSNATPIENVDGRSAASTFAGSFAQKSYGSLYQVGGLDGQAQGDAANSVRKSSATVSDTDLWLMLIVGVGLVVVQLRRKQRLLTHQTLGAHSWRDKVAS